MLRETQSLFVFLHGERIGKLVQLRRGAVHFYYESHLRPSMTPLSLSLPLENRGRLNGAMSAMGDGYSTQDLWQHCGLRCS